MCNLYSVTKGQQAVLAFTRAIRDRAGNLPSMPGVFPDYAAPIVRTGADGTRELVTARWSMPSPVFALKGRSTDPGVTNIRNLASPHWRRWTGEAHRCLVPFTSFSEYDTDASGKKVPVWFAFDESRPLAVFAGIWTTWTSTRKKAEGEVTADLFGFLTSEPNAEVGAAHPKAMPVILTTAEEWTRGCGRRGRRRPRCSGRFPTARSRSWRVARSKTVPSHNEAQAIVEVGRDLIAVRAALGHGHFHAWVEVEFGMSPDKAQRIMNVARRFGEMPHLAAFPVSALYELAAPSTPPEVCEAVVERAAAGEKVKVGEAPQLGAGSQVSQP